MHGIIILSLTFERVPVTMNVMERILPPPPSLLVILLGTATAFQAPVGRRKAASRKHEHYHFTRRAPSLFAKKVSFDTIDVDDSVDPEWINTGKDENYDNDFDVDAFSVERYSCVVNYDDISSPYLSSLDSESTWLVYDDENGVCAPAGIVGQLKETVSNQLNEPLAEVIISASVLVSSALVAISTIDQMPYESELLFATNIFNVVFAVDFFGRWFSSTKDSGRHVLDPQFALDVAVVLFPLVFGLMPDIDKAALPLPNWLTSPSALINLKLLRVLRLRRVFRDKKSFGKFERALGIQTDVEEWQLQLARIVLSLFTLLSVSTGLIYTAENRVNPCISNYFSALYFGLVTLSTVGTYCIPSARCCAMTLVLLNSHCTSLPKVSEILFQ